MDNKRQIKLIRNVYKYNEDLYEDLDSCLSDVMSGGLDKLIKKHQIDNLPRFIQLMIADDDFKKQVDEVLNVENYEVIE